MKRTAATFITLGLLAALVWFGRKAPSAGAAATTPADCIERMYAALEHGDVEAYRDCFAGSARERLERAIESQPRDALARELREEFRQLKGRAYVGPLPAAESLDRAEIALERVFVHRLERQTFRLVRQRGAWRIEQVETAAAVQPAQPYGQPVFDLAPDEEAPER